MVDNLPHEILQQIFAYAYPEVDIFHGDHASGTSIWTVSQVSRIWRAVTIGSKALWRRLLVTASHYPPTVSEHKAAFRACLVLSRSGDLPLSVRIDMTASGVWYFCSSAPAAFGPIFANSNRLQAFIDDDDCDALEMLTAWDLPLPQLRMLRLSGRHASLGLQKPILQFDAPCLHTLWLNGLEQDLDTDEPLILTLFPKPCPQVRQLILESSDLGDVQFPDLEMLHATAEDLADEGSIPTPTRLEMARLKYISIEGPGENVTFIMDQIRAPQLVELHLDLKDSLRDYTSDSDQTSSDDDSRQDGLHPCEARFLQSAGKFLRNLNSRSSLTCLSLHGTSDLSLLRIVSKLPSLRSLAVDQQLYDEKLVDFLTWTGLKPKRTLPYLESLALKYSPDATQTENRRIISMLLSRRIPLAHPEQTKGLVSVEILYHPAHGSALMDETTGLFPQLASLPRLGRCKVSRKSLADMKWRPLRPRMQDVLPEQIA
ncbi:hypothetical protein NMY22_g13337 [Coprinellus aureogranulatus]|nr:hypothetical protein NMY22_g13337 [Coprinellus aureogranulatus]